MSKEIWFNLCFNGQAVDDIVCESEEEAQEMLAHSSLNFHDQNSEIVDWWLEQGFEDNPIVTIIRTED